MLKGIIRGNIVSTRKQESLVGSKFMEVQLIKNGNLTEEDFQTYRFTPEVLQDFQEYTRMYEQNQGNGAALQSRFGKTYWFYYHFATMKK